MTTKPFLETLKGQAQPTPPIWLMRQAGRYLPEYRETRAAAKTFLNLCYTPEMAVEVTMQPIRRYRFDAAIVFSDILVIPDALGQRVSFVPGDGPQLRPPLDAPSVSGLKTEGVLEHLEPVFAALRGLSEALPKDVGLIGFAGAPWTVATYMIGGAGSKDQVDAKLFYYNEPKAFEALMDILIDATSAYLEAQVAAGAEALQLFDSWAGGLPPAMFDRVVIEPNRRIRAQLAERCPGVPVIGFPRAAGVRYEKFVAETGVDAVSLDTSVDLGWARERLSASVALQGNFDPLLLIVGGADMTDAAKRMVDTMAGVPYVFNLGHGILPQTPPEHVAQILDIVRRG
ncbi:MAG: uroporphyrinogen decarboxylase [Pseudomonadota bacterium]